VIPTALFDHLSVVYSGGVGEDASFDLALIDRTGCEVWAFDPTPRAIEFARTIGDPRFHFVAVGLWSSEARLRFHAPPNPSHVSHSIVEPESSRDSFEVDCKSLDTLMVELGHDRIDLLKLDIEGAEYEVLRSMTVHPACICVELHPIVPLDEIVAFVQDLPYEVLHVEGWNATLTLL
jgi:FkbM family methyltransferase